ncbi:trihelix transcription factor GT-3b-like [Typha latifolia]|uniref:trihelix transcription factor GT-3b-like n=1 Tax=Typha latifolia TaxID=4733 RepID=UPI003C2F6BC9
MDQYHHLNFHTNPYLNVNPPPPPDRERLPQWSHAETMEFISIRSELDESFMTTKRNKPLWDSISSRLQLKGFSRTPDQCKSKWKNLVTRFKGSEATEQEGSKQFPFHEEMRRIFSSRMERSLLAFDKKGKEVRVGGKDWDEEEEEEEDEEEEEEERGKKKRKVVEVKKRGLEREVEVALREFVREQMEMGRRWLQAAEAREAERRAMEEEWRRAMVALGEQRVALMKGWREREEERRLRAEERAERQHALVTVLLEKISEQGV